MKNLQSHNVLRVALAACVLVTFFCGAGSVLGQGARPKLLSSYDIPGLQNHMNFDTKGMDVVTFIETWAGPDVGGDFNVFISPNVQGSVRLSLKKVMIADALEIAFAVNKLAYEVKGEGENAIVYVTTDDEYRQAHGVGFYEQRDVKIVNLKYAQPSRVNGLLAGVVSGIGKIIFDDISGTLVLIDTPGKIAEMEAIIEQAEIPTIQREIPTVTKVFNLQYADPEKLEAQVADLLTKEAGSHKMNVRTKTLIVTDVESAIARVTEMIDAFDKRPLQVALEAKIVEVELSDQNSLGVNWSHVLAGIGPRFQLESKVPLSGAAGPMLSYKTIVGGGDLNIVVDALKTVGDTKVISNPHISVMDGEEASIKVIRKQPYKEVAYESGTTNVIGVSYQFVEIGTTLSVKPTINESGFVSVDIKPTISDLVDWYDAPGGSGGIVGIPVVKEAEATTSVVVKDGVTIIIGGMIKTEKSRNTVGVPILKSIPLLGNLFKSTVEGQQKTETIVFLTPKIVTGEEPFLQKPGMEKRMKFRGGSAAEIKRKMASTKSAGKGAM